MDLKTLISKNISWLETMHSKEGYIGPVTHFWGNNIHYIGLGYDWRYEGIMAGYINLYEKFGKEEFLNIAIKCGDELIKAQLPSGCFIHSKFESNPSFRGQSAVHEAGCDVGLLLLARILKKKKDIRWKKYFNCAKTNIEKLHINILWSEEHGSFYQYHLKRRFVSNKISTTIEALLLLAELSGEVKYKAYAIKAGNFLLTQQNENGGLYQEDENGQHFRMITYYNSRSIPSLVLLYKETGKRKYLDCALKIGEFIKSMKRKKGGYYFGYILKDNTLKLKKYPIFVAGSSDIIRGLYMLKKYKFNYNINEDLKWLEKNMDKNGGIRSFKGKKFEDKLSWLDVLHVVGWNDKYFRLCSELITKNDGCPEFIETENVKVKCADGIYYEDKDKIMIKNDIKYGDIIMDKSKMFSSITTPKIKLAFNMAKFYTSIPRVKVLDEAIGYIYNSLWDKS